MQTSEKEPFRLRFLLERDYLARRVQNLRSLKDVLKRVGGLLLYVYYRFFEHSYFVVRYRILRRSYYGLERAYYAVRGWVLLVCHWVYSYRYKERLHRLLDVTLDCSQLSAKRIVQTKIALPLCRVFSARQEAHAVADAIYVDLANGYFQAGDTRSTIATLEAFLHHVRERDNIFLRNKILNKLEYVKKESVLTSKPLKLEVALTGRCNIKCVMCVQDGSHAGELTQERCDEIRAHMPYLEMINWIGGEVFMSPFFEPLYDEAARYPRLKQNIITNGLYINERWAEKLAKNSGILLVSIDGLTTETYERIRRGGKFNNLTASLTCLKTAFAAHPRADETNRLAMNFILMKDNLHELMSILDFAQRFGINLVQIGNLLKFEPESVYQAQRIDTDPALVDWFMDTARPWLLREGAARKIKVEPIPTFDRPAKPSQTAPTPGYVPTPPHNPPDSPCPYPWSSFSADDKGRVRPYCRCGRDETFAGNVYEETIASAWNSAGMGRYRLLARNIDEDALACRRCPNRNYRLFAKLWDALW
ncbi:MAG: radical SAM protein [Elusimicrobiota bacterium]